MRKYVFLLLLLASGVSTAQEPVFHLCTRFVDTVAMTEGGEGWEVHLRLTADGARQFRVFTKQHEQRTVRINAGDAAFSRFTVYASAGSRLRRSADSRSEAETWVSLLLERLPEAPCGRNEQEAVGDLTGKT